mmetsp:Transcript_41115/g.100869  ORF Transcript_41115/g.100869 Transcript_41115/m.100869 type:complete len:423 (+) Transcript_41115:135-1403(+)
MPQPQQPGSNASSAGSTSGRIEFASLSAGVEPDHDRTERGGIPGMFRQTTPSTPTGTPKKGTNTLLRQEQVGRDEVNKVKYKLLAGRSNLPLAEMVANNLEVDLMDATVEAFNDGESKIQLIESVRNVHVYVLQSTCPPVNDNLMELFLLVRTLRRASASSITAIMPYFGYARQDRKTTARVPISASDVAMLLESAGVDRVLAIDLHCGQIQGFFHHSPVDNLSALREMAPYVVRNIVPEFNDEPICICSPDAGGVARAKMFLECLTSMNISDIGLAITVKHRAGPGEVEGMNVVGEIDGKHCIIVDDMIDTAGTLCKSAETLMEMGAKSVSACATHGLLTGPAMDRIKKSCMAHVIVSDSIPLKPGAPDKIKVVSVAGLIAEAIQCMTTGQSVSGLFALPSPVLQASMKQAASCGKPPKMP